MPERYEIITDTAGEGGYGVVHKAKDNTLERNVAIKQLDPLFRREIGDDDKERFRREAKNLAKLTHPNIPAIYDISFNEDDFKIYFQWIDGLNIHEHIKINGPMQIDEVEKYFFYVCNALEHIHKNEIIHRDIKPSNIIITEDKLSCYIVDLGIALNKSDLERISSGKTIGTPGYMSPEQENGEELTNRSDIFSLAITLYECLSGMRPVVGTYIPLTEHNESIPPAIDSLIQESLSIVVDERPSSSVEFYDRVCSALLPPQSSIATILTEGTLYQIQNAILTMDQDSFSSLSAGQKRLIVSRLRDLINTNRDHMKNAVASLVYALMKHVFLFRDDFSIEIINRAFQYGFEMNYTEEWRGNKNIRENIAIAAKKCHKSMHGKFSQALVEHFSNDKFSNEDKWYYHSLRDIIQLLMANGYCSENSADILGDLLDRLNALTHLSPQEDPGV